MRIFEHFNEHGEVCPICKTKDDKETVLISIVGTQEGYTSQALQVHYSCYRQSLDFDKEPLIWPDKRFLIIQYPEVKE